MRLKLKKQTSLVLAIIAFTMIASAGFLLPVEASAATSQNNFDITKGITENLGCTGFNCQLCNLVTLINNLISFFIYLGTVVAIFLMAWVGFLYITAGGDPGASKKAKEIFWNVIWGFVIMLCAYLFIDTVLKSVLREEATKFGPWNPIQCVDLPTSTTGGGTGGRGPGGGGTSYVDPAKETCVRKDLADNGVDTNRANFCQTSTSRECTNVSGLPRSAIDGVIKLRRDVFGDCSDCDRIVLSGGSEQGPHVSHGPGKSIVDVRFNGSVSAYIRRNGTYAGIENNNVVYTMGGNKFVFETADSRNAHFHIVFSGGDTSPYSCVSAI